MREIGNGIKNFPDSLQIQTWMNSALLLWNQNQPNTDSLNTTQSLALKAALSQICYLDQPSASMSYFQMLEAGHKSGSTWTTATTFPDNTAECNKMLVWCFQISVHVWLLFQRKTWNNLKDRARNFSYGQCTPWKDPTQHRIYSANEYCVCA